MLNTLIAATLVLATLAVGFTTLLSVTSAKPRDQAAITSLN